MHLAATPDVTLGIGGTLHDYHAAVLRRGRVVSEVSAAATSGLAHGVDVREMEELFARATSSERAVGRWLLRVRETRILDGMVRTALDRAGFGLDEVVAVGHTCPDLLVPGWLTSVAATTRVNQLQAHAAGIVDAAEGDSILVLAGTGDRDARGCAEVSALYRHVCDGIVRVWVVHEPASLGVLLDGALMVNGARALDRSDPDRVFDDDHATQTIWTVGVDEDSYELDGMTWHMLSHQDRREAYVASRMGTNDRQARRSYARAALAVARAVVHGVARTARPDGDVWICGEATLHPALIKDLPANVRTSPLRGHAGAAIGAARMAAAATSISLS